MYRVGCCNSRDLWLFLLAFRAAFKGGILMTLSQALVCIDKDRCRKVSVSMEFGDGSRSEVFKFSPNAINEIFAHISPLSPVLAFLDRKGSVNIVVAYTAQSYTLKKQLAEGVWGEPIYV